VVESSFVHVTVVPVLTVIVDGTKAKLLILIAATVIVAVVVGVAVVVVVCTVVVVVVTICVVVVGGVVVVVGCSGCAVHPLRKIAVINTIDNKIIFFIKTLIIS
jgi:hypothetical protein